jgi:ferredoxin
VPVEGGYHVEIVSDKGALLVKAHPACFSDPRGGESAVAFRQQARRRVGANLEIDPPRIRAWLADHFEHRFFAGLGLRCHGCGACASVCPTCHCFDIVDEPEGLLAGTRRRHWYTCKTGKFTVHASGHNPRGDRIPGSPAGHARSGFTPRSSAMLARLRSMHPGVPGRAELSRSGQLDGSPNRSPRE